jgi:hypothetical protein
MATGISRCQSPGRPVRRQSRQGATASGVTIPIWREEGAHREMLPPTARQGGLA